MENRTIVVLNPTATAEAREIAPAGRVDDLKGKTVGLLWNNKPNGDLLLADIGDILSARAGIAGVKQHRKTSPAVMADDTVLADLAQHCDLVVNAVGD